MFKKLLFGGWGGRAKPLFLLSVVFFLVIGLASWFKTDGIRAVLDSDRKIQAKKEELKRLEEQNAALKERIKSAQTGSYETEKYAREKLLMAKKNETVFRFRDTSSADEEGKKE